MIKVKTKERHGEFKRVNGFSITECPAMKACKKVPDSTIGSFDRESLFFTLSKFFFRY